MAAIVYFEKTAEDDERVTYRCGLAEDAWERSFAFIKADRMLAGDLGPISGQIRDRSYGRLAGIPHARALARARGGRDVSR